MCVASFVITPHGTSEPGTLEDRVEVVPAVLVVDG